MVLVVKNPDRGMVAPSSCNNYWYKAYMHIFITPNHVHISYHQISEEQLIINEWSNLSLDTPISSVNVDYTVAHCPPPILLQMQIETHK